MYSNSEKANIHTSDVIYSAIPTIKENILVCASHGRVFALHKGNGSFLWNTKIPSQTMGSLVSVFVTDSNTVIAGSRGATVCLDLFTGEVKWRNDMKGFCYETVSVISNPTRNISHSTGGDLPPYSSNFSFDKPIVFASSYGKMMAIDGDTGEEIWRYNCPGAGYYLPVVIVEPPAPESNQSSLVVYVGIGKYIFCLVAHSGVLVWKQKMPVSIVECFTGQNYMSLATPMNSRLAAETQTAFSQNPAGQDCEIEKERRKRH
ncbi:hypothetical protein BDB01DRAFT_797474 [Pilobolus umbonatus]|nr:hypothetical protein BDB01DRAFT_797474 [Pilobolus umbonatus]